MTRRWRLDFWSGVLAVALAVVAVLMVWPLYNIFATSVIDNRSGALTFANFAQILGRPAYRGALINSLIAVGYQPVGSLGISRSASDSTTCPSSCCLFEKRLAQSKIDRKNIFLLKTGRAVNFRLYLQIAAKYPDHQAFLGD